MLINNNVNNVLTALLSCLNIKYTNNYANKLYNEHPHKYDLMGLSSMLNEYCIKNHGYKINDKNELYQIETPFVVHTGSDFAVVYKMDAERVFYIWNGKKIKVLFNEFYHMWSGIILYAQPDENSIETNYIDHLKKEIFVNAQRILLAFSIFFILIFFIVKNEYYSIAFGLLTIINLIGIYISYLLVLKQFHSYSVYADKICTLFKQNDCNNILELDVAKLGGIIGWSEIGLGYFLTNLIMLTCFPDLLKHVAIINIFTLPYTFWSIWFQKFKAKQWCVLCVIVQILLWVIFTISIAFELIDFNNMNIIDLLLVCLFYLSIILFINILSKKMSKERKLEQTTQELNSIKSNEEVFALMLKKQPHYSVDRKYSSILWGNKESNILITVFTNPHCNPCAKMHRRIESILNSSNNLCIQYVFSSFNQDLDDSNKFLIAVFLNKEQEERKAIYSDWFTEGNAKRDLLLKVHNVNISDENVIAEFHRHNNWKRETGLVTTPTILVNGYKLPDNYKIEDLAYVKILD